jgi:hypothetical protein
MVLVSLYYVFVCSYETTSLAVIGCESQLLVRASAVLLSLIFLLLHGFIPSAFAICFVYTETWLCHYPQKYICIPILCIYSTEYQNSSRLYFFSYILLSIVQCFTD